MARPIEATEAAALLTEAFAAAEDDHRTGAAVHIPAAIIKDTESLFASKTQAFREALIGCAVAHILDPKIDIRLPATEHGEDSFSGRSLSDKVVAPFLRDRSIPASGGPYLSALRGGAKFIKGGAPRIQRDEVGFDALVAIVAYLRGQGTDATKSYLRHLLRCFVRLRESSNITLKSVAKPNLDHLGRLVSGLLTVKSGGRIPALLATAMFQTLSECHGLGWEVEYQGINVADKQSGAVGDITVRKKGAVILGVEVTERSVDRARVKSIFEQKVSPVGLEDYLFITTTAPQSGAAEAARRYTGLGNEMNFVPLDGWLVHNLATIGPKCRAIYQAKMLALIGSKGVPAEIRVAWNAKMDQALGVKMGNGV